jgi:hypothetical protein
MKGIVGRALGLSIVLASTAVTLMAGETPQAKDAGIPLITDWTHQHVIFSQPRTAKQRAALQKDIRYQQQWARHMIRPTLNTNVSRAAWRRFRRLQGGSSSGVQRDWTSPLGGTGTSLAGRFPAKYSFSSTVAVCGGSLNPDFIVYATGAAPSGTQASIVGLTNLYAGCPNTPIPAGYFAYNTGGTVTTSPVLSYDGTQFAFTQTVAGSASLVLVRWTGGGTVQAPVTPASVSAASYLGCTAPCMTTFSLGAADTNSSVFYDYGTDVAYVGDDAGKLHQFTGVFKGTPAQVTTGGWPVTVSGNKLSSAVYDAGTGNVFVGDNGGFLYRVSSTGAVTASLQLARAPLGLLGGPVVDRGISVVYAFAASDGANAGVYQLSTSFAAGSAGTEVKVGGRSNGTTLFFNGAFDHNYIFSANSTGTLYVCGAPGGSPTLYKVPIAAGVMGTAVAGPVLSTTTRTNCSPVTDVYNPSVTGQGLPEEWAFASVQAAGSPTPCGTFSCLMSFRTSSWQPNTVYNAGQLILDPTMRIQVADNSGGTSGATQPAWKTGVFVATQDGTVHWRVQGKLSGPSPNPWTPSFTYPGNFEILDTNGNIEINRTANGTSGAVQPTWPTAEGATTTDGTVTWYNLGANPVAAIQEAGGTSGIVIDNTTLPGSQLYFSTLGGGCAPGGTGNCAVAVTQQGLN